MRFKNLFTYAASLCFVLQMTAVKGQYLPAVNPASIISTGQNAQYTNTSAAEFVGASIHLQTMVWEGMPSSFGWDYGGNTGDVPLAGNALGLVTVPDIVTDPSATPNLERALIVYLVNNSQVFFEVHRWNGSTFVLEVPPTQISTPMSTLLSTPNADISRLGDVVMTWSENGMVKGKAFKMNSLTLSPNTYTASNCVGAISSRTCDVAIYDRNWTGNGMVNFVFISQINPVPAQVIYLQRATFNDVWSGAPCNPGLQLFLDDHQFGGFANPRIACPNLFNGADLMDVAVVCGHEMGNIYEIKSYVHDAATYGPNNFFANTLNNGPGAMNLTTCAAKHPSLCYFLDRIQLTWSQENCLGGIGGFTNVLARPLNFDGTTLLPDYQVLNFSQSGNHQYSSVGGKFSRIYGFYTWTNPSSNQVKYKNPIAWSTSLRLSQNDSELESNTVESQLAAFPNPFSNAIQFSFQLAPEEEALSMQVFDLSGKLVATLPVNTAQGSQLQLNWQANSDLANGVYQARLLTSQRSEIVRVVKN